MLIFKAYKNGFVLKSILFRRVNKDRSHKNNSPFVFRQVNSIDCPTEEMEKNHFSLLINNCLSKQCIKMTGHLCIINDFRCKLQFFKRFFELLIKHLNCSLSGKPSQ